MAMSAGSGLEGKVALITGASGGIGSETARRLAKAGAKIALHYHSNKAAADGLAAEIRSAGGEAVVIGGGIGRELALMLNEAGARVVIGDVDGAAAKGVAAQAVAEMHATSCDIGEDASVNAFADFAFDKLGRVDLLFNHAGVSVGGLLEQIPSEDWNWMLNVNLTGLGRSISAFVPRMTEQGGGWIVNTSSGLGLFHDMPFGGPYLATKAGIIAYSRALATYTRNRGIGVSVFCPDATATNFMSAGRLTGIPKEILAAGVSADQIQTARQAAEVLIEGLKADRFLISAVPDTSEKLLAMAKADLAPESDAFDEHGQSRVVVSKGGLRVPLDKRDEALALFREFAAITQDHYGCQFYDITISASDPEQLVIFEVWDSKAALDAHAAAPGAMDLIMKLFALGASDFGVQEIR